MRWDGEIAQWAKLLSHRLDIPNLCKNGATAGYMQSLCGDEKQGLENHQKLARGIQGQENHQKLAWGIQQ